MPVLCRIKFYPNLFKFVLFFPFSVHKGIRYSCDYCEKSFTQSNNLKLHIRNAHEFILNEKGNSELGMKALERLTTLTGVSVF